MDPDFKLRFLFAGQLGPEVTVQILRTELDHRLAQVREPGWMDFTTVELDPVPEIDPEWARTIQLSAHEFGYSNTAAYIAWLQLTLAKAEVAAGRVLSDTPYRGPESAD